MTGAVWTLIGLLLAAQLGMFYFVRGRIDSLGDRVDSRLDSLTTRLGQMQETLGRVDERSDAVQKQLEGLSNRLETVQERVAEATSGVQIRKTEGGP